MSKNNIQTILNGKATIEQLLMEDNDQSFSKVVLTKKTASKLLNLLKEEIDKPGGSKNVATILKKLSSNTGAIKQMSDLRTHLPYLMDKIIQIALEGNPETNDYMKIVQSYIYENSILKSSLCMSIEEYLLNAIDSHSLPNEIIKDTLEVLVSTVTHHPDNRSNFIRHIKTPTLGNIFSIVTSTGDPMIQLYGAEFLWRIATPMKSLTEETIQQLFGNMSSALFAITASNFRKGIIDFVINVNSNRTDPDIVFCAQIENLLIGHKKYKEDSIVMAGSTGIIIWSGNDMISFPKEDILGIWENDSQFIIRLSENYDTLIDYFSEDKILSFTVTDFNPFGEICRARYKIGDPNDIPDIYSNSKFPQTPQPTFRSFNKLKIPKSTTTSKSPKPKVPKLEKKKETEQIAIPPRSIQSRPVSKISYKESISTEETLSSYTPAPPPKKPTYKDWLRAEEKKKALKSPVPIKSPKEKSIQKKILQETPKKSNLNPKEKPLSIKSKKLLSNSSDDELIIESSSFFDTDSLSLSPPISSSINNNNSNNNSDFDKKNAKKMSNNENGKKKNMGKVSEKDQLEIIENFSEPELPEITRREYTPEGWEIEIFDELRNFGECVREELNSRQSAIKAALETTAAQALEAVRDFVLQCDSDLQNMRDEFTSSAEAMAEELEQKQTMVGALGEQQCDHIDDMIEECTNLSKRISDTLTKMESQKRTLQENQQKHIQLFKEDLKSELLSKRATKRTRNTKKNTEILNSLLNGL